MITSIFCVNKLGYIGKKNKLLYNIPEDIKNFKKLTTDNTVVMGYNTFKSLNYIPLANRKNIILTKNHYDEIKIRKDIKVFKSLFWLKIYMKFHKRRNFYIIGGKKLYENIKADKIIMTHIDDYKDGDVKLDLIKILKSTSVENIKDYTSNNLKVSQITLNRYNEVL